MTGPNKPPSKAPNARPMKQRVKTAAKRSVSSARWLERQLNDPYVADARRQGWRSRAAFKLIQLDETCSLLRGGLAVIDLGAAPGGWCQVLAQRLGQSGKIVGIDLLPIDPLAGVTLIEGDFMDDSAPAQLTAALGRQPDLVLSDMAPSTTGHRPTDHLRILGLAEAAAAFAEDVLAPGGAFVCKLFQGGETAALLAQLKPRFTRVKHVKPDASRAESSEIYLVCQGYRGPLSAE